ncbi:DNA helicase [Viridothelium virens]|uniref:DNA helicase n=1 Tax=Viridothelium virens TaxID=1048519 RepID=A0A6A6HMN1_VIRVR|nr:DNA helicase [Viridothelium virens]
MAPVAIPTFASHQLNLLSAELAAETSATALLTSTHSPSALSRAGLAITNLVIDSQRTGLGGKTVVQLGRDSAVGVSGKDKGGKSSKSDAARDASDAAGLGEHGIRVGDVVGIGQQPKGAEKKKAKSELEKSRVEGVVVKVRQDAIEVAVEKEDDAEGLLGGSKLWIVKLANEITYKRMNQTMTYLEKMEEAEYTPFIRVLFGLDSVTPVPPDIDLPSSDYAKIVWDNPHLNDSQKSAIRFALASREIALIHGPPGTGKTYTIIELILQLLARKQRVLVCGPSNISVDNIVERLAPHGLPLVRLGHPARLLPSVLAHSLDVLTRTSEAAAIVRDVAKEMDAKQASIKKTKSGRERREIYSVLRELRKEYRERERGCVDQLIHQSKVVLATLHGAGGFHLKGQQFDVVIIDEASQALEAQCWVPLLRAKKVVLAGDHLQLPPTVKSLNVKEKSKTGNAEQAKADGKNGEDGLGQTQSKTKGGTLETTMFDRLLRLYGPSVKRMLTVQYRMHEQIMTFPSEELYEGKLVAAEDVKSRLLKDLPYEVMETDETKEALVFLDTQGGDFPEKTEADDGGKSLLGDSKSNEMEALLVGMQVKRLVEAGVKATDIAVITPYNGQLSILSRSLKEAYPGIELGSVDGFQGREKEAVIVSLVRSNPEHEVGFLGEKRRLNVAMTRPKRHLCVIGDSETVSRGSNFLARWMAFLEEHADLRYPNLADLHVDG